MNKPLFSLFYISFKMYFQNSSYVIECSMDAFEDVWCMCECMMYVMICDVSCMFRCVMNVYVCYIFISMMHAKCMHDNNLFMLTN